MDHGDSKGAITLPTLRRKVQVSSHVVTLYKGREGREGKEGREEGGRREGEGGRGGRREGGGREGQGGRMKSMVRKVKRVGGSE